MLLSWALLLSSASAGPIDTLLPGEWYMFPGSNMSAVDPCPARNCNYTGAEGQAAVMNDWAGGAYDTTRDRLMVWGGGHGGYGGNEAYAFSLATGTWTRLTEPSSPVTTCTDFYPDGRPASTHSYNFLQYLPSLDAFVTFSAGQFCPAGGAGALGAVALILTSNTWSIRAPYPPVGSHIGAITAYDPSTGHVWMKATGYSPNYDAATTLYRYDPINNNWTAGDGGNSDLAFDYGLTAAIDHTRRKMVAVGGGKIVVWDISNPLNVTRQNVTSTGATSILNANDPGFVYDPVSDRFVAWSGGTAVYTLNPATWVWTQVNAASTNTVAVSSLTANERGTYGRFRYIPSKNAFIVVNHTTENVFVYKLTSAVSPAPSVLLASNVASVAYGASATLNWSSTNSKSCAASGAWSGTKAINGSQTLSALSASATYTLACSGANGSASQSVAISVTGVPQ